MNDYYKVSSGRETYYSSLQMSKKRLNEIFGWKLKLNKFNREIKCSV